MKYESTFNSSNEIKNFYECFVWKMPRRSDGRSTIHVETILFSEFILHYLKAPFWEYPVTVKYQDRPDFVIQSGKKLFGIEITEQWSRNYGQALSMLENSEGVLEPSDFKFSKKEKKIKGKKIAELVAKQTLTGPPSMGDQEEVNWIQRTIRTITQKDKKFINYPNAQDFDENFLVIFDVRAESPFFENITDEMLIPLYALYKTTSFTHVVCIDNHIVTIDLKNQKFTYKTSNY